MCNIILWVECIIKSPQNLSSKCTFFYSLVVFFIKVYLRMLFLLLSTLLFLFVDKPRLKKVSPSGKSGKGPKVVVVQQWSRLLRVKHPQKLNQTTPISRSRGSSSEWKLKCGGKKKLPWKLKLGYQLDLNYYHFTWRTRKHTTLFRNPLISLILQRLSDMRLFDRFL